MDENAPLKRDILRSNITISSKVRPFVRFRLLLPVTSTAEVEIFDIDVVASDDVFITTTLVLFAAIGNALYVHLAMLLYFVVFVVLVLEGTGFTGSCVVRIVREGPDGIVGGLVGGR